MSKLASIFVYDPDKGYSRQLKSFLSKYNLAICNRRDDLDTFLHEYHDFSIIFSTSYFKETSVITLRKKTGKHVLFFLDRRENNHLINNLENSFFLNSINNFTFYLKDLSKNDIIKVISDSLNEFD